MPRWAVTSSSQCIAASDRGHGRGCKCLLGSPVGHQGLNLFPHRFEECLLVVQDLSIRARAMSCSYNFRAQLPGRIQRRHPLAYVAVTHIVVWSVHADVAREKDTLLRQPGHCIAVSVRHSQVHEFSPMLAVVKKQVFREEDGGRLELTGS